MRFLKIFCLTFELLVLVCLVQPGFAHADNARPDARVAMVDAPRVADDAYWDDRFAPRGVGGEVRAIATSGSDVYIAGNFATAGNIAASGIVRWNALTNSWSALGSGIGVSLRRTSWVNALAISGSDVYAGGYFVGAGGTGATNIAKWNGASWSVLGSGVDGTVNAIAVNGNDVYVGGYFWTAGGINTASIAKWNSVTQSWSTLGDGLRYSDGKPATIYAIAIIGSDVYVGGDFVLADNGALNYLVKWDGANWSALGSGVGGTVHALAANGNDLYVGGSFADAGGISASNIAKWNGATWSALGNGVGGIAGYKTVSAIITGGDLVYVGGNFSAAGNTSVNNIAKWDGATWSALGGGVGLANQYDSVNAIALTGAELVAGGKFVRAGNLAAHYIAKWNNTTWSALSAATNNGVTNSIDAIAVNGNDVYVGGEFQVAGNVLANRVAKWNGATWSALGSGVTGADRINTVSVHAIAVSGDDVYVGGAFTTAGGIGANNIAKWNATTQTWSPLGSGVNGTVLAIAVSGNDVYVGGMFSVVGGVSASRIAKWNGSAWTALGTGIGGHLKGTPTVSAIGVNGSDVYVGGSFTTAGNITARHIAKWNGATWSALGTGVDDASGSVSDIVVIGNTVYIGGSFTSVGGIAARNLARWNGGAWSSVGGGVDAPVNALAVNGGNVYVGSYSRVSFVSSITYLAVWNGCTWSALGSNVDDSIYAIAANGNDVYVGGTQSVAGNKPSERFAHWSKPLAPSCFHLYILPQISK